MVSWQQATESMEQAAFLYSQLQVSSAALLRVAEGTADPSAKSQLAQLYVVIDIVASNMWQYQAVSSNAARSVTRARNLAYAG